jgi:hypothetical protein
LALVHPIFSDTSVQELQEDINKIDKCVNTLGLSLNIKKCQFLQISLSRTPVPPVLLTLRGEPLTKVTSYRYLGVDIEEKFTFEKQTKRAVSNAKKSIGTLNRVVRIWASAEVLRQAIMTLALPVLFYGIEVWYPPHNQQREQIERVNKFAARLLLNDFNSETSYSSLLERLKWHTIHRLVLEKRLVNLRKYMDGKRFVNGGIFELESPSVLRSSQRLRERKTKNSLTIQTHDDHKNTMEEKMVVHQSIISWNALNEDIVKSSSAQFRKIIQSDELYTAFLPVA